MKRNNKSKSMQYFHFYHTESSYNVHEKVYLEIAVLDQEIQHLFKSYQAETNAGISESMHNFGNILTMQYNKRAPLHPSTLHEHMPYSSIAGGWPCSSSIRTAYNRIQVSESHTRSEHKHLSTLFSIALNCESLYEKFAHSY